MRTCLKIWPLAPVPTAADLIEGIQTLPVELMAHLLEVFERGSGSGFILGSVRLGPTVETELRIHKVVYYDEIRTARAGLYRLINTGPSALVRMFRAGGPLVTVNDDHKIEIQLDMFGAAVQGVDVRYLRVVAKMRAHFLRGSNLREFEVWCWLQQGSAIRSCAMIAGLRNTGKADYQGAPY